MNKKLITLLSSIVIILILSYFFLNAISGYSTPIKDNEVQNSIGVNIHFISPNLNEAKTIYNAGFKTVRMDLFWNHIEKSRGVYDFSEYDKLVDEMTKNKMDILFILDFSNILYDNGLAPYSEYGREAFVNFASAAVKHYKGKSIMWEIWNEPNTVNAWKPKPNVESYYKLAISTITAIRLVDRNAFIVAPAVGVDYSYLDYLGKNNLFKDINAVSIHPYRLNNPETVVGDYNKIKVIIDKYPHKEGIQLFCGEWGYSTTWAGIDATKQAQYCVREYLTNLMCGINLTIWYDWKNDGIDPKNVENNFGCVYNNLEPKPAYYAITTLTSVLNGYKFVKRIDDGQTSDYILMFQKDNMTAYALWTTGTSHTINIKLPSSNNARVIDINGKTLGNSYNISQSVIYIADSN